MVSNGCDQVPPDLQFLAGFGTSGVHSKQNAQRFVAPFRKEMPIATFVHHPSTIEKWPHTTIFFDASRAVLSEVGTLPWSFQEILDAWWWISDFSLLEQVPTHSSHGWTPAIFNWKLEKQSNSHIHSWKRSSNSRQRQSLDENAPGSFMGVLFDSRKHKGGVQHVVCCFLAFHSACAFSALSCDSSQMCNCNCNQNITCRSFSCVPQDTNLSSEVYETLLKTGEGGTLDVAFSIISLSFNALLSGKWPTRDWKGQQHSECSIASFFSAPIITVRKFLLALPSKQFQLFSSACLQHVGIRLRVPVERRQGAN